MSDLIGNVPDGSGGDGNHVETPNPQATGNAVGNPAPVEPPKWKAQVRDDLKQNEWLNQFSDLNALGEAAVAMNGKLQAAVEIPGEGASAEVIQRFREKMQVPASATDYGITTEGLPDLGENAPDQSTIDSFQQFAHAQNMPKPQAEATWKWWAERADAQLKAQTQAKQAARDATEKALRAELGEKYDTVLTRAGEAIAQFGGQEFAAFLKEAQLTNDARMIKFMAAIGTAFADDTIPLGGPAGAPKAQRNETVLSDKVNFTFPESSKYFPKK